jgi:hypothetical protein
LFCAQFRLIRAATFGSKRASVRHRDEHEGKGPRMIAIGHFSFAPFRFRLALALR